MLVRLLSGLRADALLPALHRREDALARGGVTQSDEGSASIAAELESSKVTVLGIAALSPAHPHAIGKASG